MARRIKRAQIDFISLVPRGANRFPVLYKSDDQVVEFDTLVKADMDKGELTAVVYAPETRDSQGDVASAEVIKEMAHNFAKNGKGVDIRHDGKVVAKDAAFVAESFIIQKGDPRFADMKDYDGNPVDVTGGWGAVLKIEDESLRRAYREGGWNGVSMGGAAEVEADKSDDGAGWLLKQLTRLFKGRADNGELDMTEAELNKILDARDEKLIEKIGDLVKPKTEPVTKENDKPEPKPAPVFKGDFSDPDAVRAHEHALAVWKAESEHANDPAALFEAMKKINEEYAQSTDDLDAEAGVEKGDSPEVRTLKRKLHKAQKRSNQTPTNKADDGNNDFLGSGLGGDSAAIMKMAGEDMDALYQNA